MLSAMTLEDDVPQYKTYMAGFAARAIAKVYTSLAHTHAPSSPFEVTRTIIT